ncbi:helix-turn-helix domain-containing protein [Streptomyces barringtoniae]|uniref:helix-turn-helix domain-containing protein n=1 Tax=Streptomyces barringtoniae TaxID=2892029 RepID=UPI001E354BDB|nr:XRE family transcriptional regulator [Streptomyces barringtoniae]MCC5477315.1 XRE family transcriptional regulator [Streptomyces barringtoniae]
MTSGDPSVARPLECERLAETLRGLRARTGLSLAALAAKTPYSKSSWDRYLNGRTVPPRQAVAKLCELAGEDPGRALALWELADAVASGRAAGGRASAGRAAGGRPPTGVPAPAPAESLLPSVPRPARRGLIAAVMGGGLTVAALVLALAATGAFSESGSSASPSPSPSAPVQGCHGTGCTGKDPETYGCGADPVPVTLGRQSFPGPTVVKIRHSTVCGAVWARIDLGKVGDRAEILVPHHAPWRIEVKDRYDAKDSLSTPMVAATPSDLDQVRACLVRDGKRRCFGPEQ